LGLKGEGGEGDPKKGLVHFFKYRRWIYSPDPLRTFSSLAEDSA
jgi:hypothetical protein